MPRPRTIAEIAHAVMVNCGCRDIHHESDELHKLIAARCDKELGTELLNYTPRFRNTRILTALETQIGKRLFRKIRKARNAGGRLFRIKKQ